VLAGARNDVGDRGMGSRPAGVGTGSGLGLLQLPHRPRRVAHRVRDGLDAMWRHMAARAEAGDITVDADGRVHAAGLKAVPESATLVELRRRCHVRR
jgi:hypothetical protein